MEDIGEIIQIMKINLGAIYRKALVKCEYCIFLRKKSNRIFIPNDMKSLICYVTVTFNCPDFFKWQMNLLKKYEKEPYCQLVIDNSSENTKSFEIENICRENDIAYVKVPENPYSIKFKSPSRSHAAAVAWAKRHVLSHVHCKYVSFIDHDIFPIKKIDLLKKITESNQDIYGLLQDRRDADGKGIWYIWPGFIIMKNTMIKNLDFTPIASLGDTGAAMYKDVYSKINQNEMKFASSKLINLYNHGDERFISTQRPECYGHPNTIEIIDDTWLHVCDGSGWLGVNISDKLGIVYDRLNSALKG